MGYNLGDSLSSHFDQIIDRHGEWIDYYSYGSTTTYDTTYGYLRTRTEPTKTRFRAIIGTFTQKDVLEHDLGNMSVDDHKAYIKNSDVTPAEKDEVVRDDGERYEVVKLIHSHSAMGTTMTPETPFHTVWIRRRSGT